MDLYSGYINKLIDELSGLPGIGSKSAQRLAFHIINMPAAKVERLARPMTDAKEHVRYCEECYTLTDSEKCPICANERRDHSVIMVVENTRDLAAYEKTGKYEGVYHVLHGAISPMLGIGPNDIKLKELMHRLTGEVKEVIIATNSSLEGETTAMYIGKLMKSLCCARWKAEWKCNGNSMRKCVPGHAEGSGKWEYRRNFLVLTRREKRYTFIPFPTAGV